MPDGHLRRMACQIAAQLPDDRGECLRILSYVHQIVDHLGGGWGAEEVSPMKSAVVYVFQPTGPGALPEGATADQNGRPDISSRE